MRENELCTGWEGLDIEKAFQGVIFQGYVKSFDRQTGYVFYASDPQRVFLHMCVHECTY
jgi:hypothetical protein